MTTPSPESLALLERAAELRASGTPWADAATQLAVEHQELRRLVADHARDYDRLARRARDEMLRETLAAALDALRTLVHGPDPRLGFLAATTVVRYELARMRHGTREAGDRLEREARRSARKLTVEARQSRVENASESPKVPNRQEVESAKKVMQSRTPESPANATPVASQPAPVKPPAPAPAAAPRAAQIPVSTAEAVRRKHLLQSAVLGQFTPPAPLTRGAPQTLEVDRLMRGWLTE